MEKGVGEHKGKWVDASGKPIRKYRGDDYDIIYGYKTVWSGPITSANESLRKKEIKLKKATKEWEKRWNAHKNKMWREQWGEERKIGKPLTLRGWARQINKPISTMSEKGVAATHEKKLYDERGKLWSQSHLEGHHERVPAMQLYEAINVKFPHLLDSRKGFGICNMSDDLFFTTDEPMAFEWAERALRSLKSQYEEYARRVPRSDALKSSKHPTQDTWEFKTKGKVNGVLLLNGSHWAYVDMGSVDPARGGGLMYRSGRGPEPKKYLRSHLFADNKNLKIKDGWMPKKQLKTLLGKPYPHPLYGALRKDGSLNTYGPEYY